MKKLEIEFASNQQNIYSHVQLLANELGITPQELTMLALIRFINDNCSLINHDEKLMFSENQIKEFISNGENILQFGRKNF